MVDPSSQVAPIVPPSRAPPPPQPSRRQRVVFRTTKLDDVEDVQLYRPGGYHPTNLGDILNQRFKVLHKLGNGGSALVWLARDLQRERYVALKILRANASAHEVDILNRMQAVTHGSGPLIGLHEVCILCGPNGIHKCLVMDLVGPSLRDITLGCSRPDLDFCKEASKHLADGVAALHAMGVIHGDLNDANVAFELKDSQNWTEDQLYEVLGRLQQEPLLQIDGSPAPPWAPTHVVAPANYRGLSVEQLSTNVRIIDYGQAFLATDPPKDLGTPASFYAPELNFGHPPSYAVDLWALGCLIYEMHTWVVLLPTPFGHVLESLGFAVECLGALPGSWQGRLPGENVMSQMAVGKDDPWFDESVARERTLESLIARWVPDWYKEQQVRFEELLKAIMNFEPGDRLHAKDVVAHAWFNDETA